MWEESCQCLRRLRSAALLSDGGNVLPLLTAPVRPLLSDMRIEPGRSFLSRILFSLLAFSLIFPSDFVCFFSDTESFFLLIFHNITSRLILTLDGVNSRYIFPLKPFFNFRFFLQCLFLDFLSSVALYLAVFHRLCCLLWVCFTTVGQKQVIFCRHVGSLRGIFPYFKFVVCSSGRLLQPCWSEHH